MTEDKFLKELANQIHQLREKKGLSIIEFAERANISRIHAYRIESGESVPTIATVRNIAAALEVKLKNLVDIE
jgi:transcriptional regulator with XRE-family HTH domain